MSEIENIIDSMEPEAALATVVAIANKLLSHAGDEARLEFVMSLMGDNGTDKISSMVNL